MLSVTLLSTSCTQDKPVVPTSRPTNTHEVWNNSAGQEMVRVQGYDSNGRLVEYFMLYSLFNSLYSRGGYGAVNNYYGQHRSTFDRSYRIYKTQYVPRTAKAKATKAVKKSIKRTVVVSQPKKITYKPTTIYKRPTTSSIKSKSSISLSKSRSSSSSISKSRSSSSKRR